MIENLYFSHRIPCVEGKTAVSPDGRLFVIKTEERLIVYCFSTLKSEIDFRTPYYIKFIKFSSDTKYIGWLSADPSILRLCEIKTKDILEIDIQPALEVISLIFGPQCLIYISELEVYVGVYEYGTHKSFTLEGCSLDDFDRPLLQFSPKGDYLCMVRGHQTVIYNTASWSLVTVFNCPVCPLVPVFTDQYTIFITNHEGVIKWYSAFGLQLKSESIPASKCLIGVELSKDRRKLFAATYDNQVRCYDTVSMESWVLLEYIDTVETRNEVQIFLVTDTIEKGPSVDSLKYKNGTVTVLKKVKNLLDDFKLKIKYKHLLLLNHDDTLLATINPSYPLVIWIWDLLKTDKLKKVIHLPAMAGSVKILRWHQHANLLAAEFTNVVVIWSDKEGLVALPGENNSFKWLNLKVPVGMIITGTDCRFVCF